MTQWNRHVGTECWVNMEDFLCRILHNRELFHLCDDPYTLAFRSYKRLNWTGNIQGMDVSNIPKQVFCENMYGKRTVGKPK